MSDPSTPPHPPAPSPAVARAGWAQAVLPTVVLVVVLGGAIAFWQLEQAEDRRAGMIDHIRIERRLASRTPDKLAEVSKRVRHDAAAIAHGDVRDAAAFAKLIEQDADHRRAWSSAAWLSREGVYAYAWSRSGQPS